jgi:putative glycosyltransferase (TIGR04372 family)
MTSSRLRQRFQIITGRFRFNNIGRMLLLLIAIPVVIAVRLMRPLVLIRFGQLRSDGIGHLAGNTELFLCERDVSMHRKRTFDIVYYDSRICNQQLKKMWDRILYVHSFAKWPDRLNRKLPGGEAHSLPFGLRLFHDRDVHGLLAHTSPHLSFTPEEERLGWYSLKKMGIPEGVPFICFHARDSSYLISVWGTDFSYHNYRDSSISNYVPAMEELTRRGYFALRMGAIVRERLVTHNSRIIDYATNGSRTDFLDIFLGAHCTFFISSGSGIDAIPMIFRRPTMFVNIVPFEYGRYWESTHVFIPKKHWLRDEHRFLTFREILDSGAGRFLRAQQFEQRGIELIENTPEEIAALAIEMDERLKGTWQTNEEDEELQRRFWGLFKPSELNQVFAAHIGAEFLRQNRELLD